MQAKEWTRKFGWYNQLVEHVGTKQQRGMQYTGEIWRREEQ
jgi:hypothetical protein